MLKAITGNRPLGMNQNTHSISSKLTVFTHKLCKVLNPLKQDLQDIKKKRQGGKNGNTTQINTPASEVRHSPLDNSQQPSPNTLSNNELKLLAVELNQVLQHYQGVQSEKHTAFLRGYLEKNITVDGYKKKIGDYIQFDTKTDSQAKFSRLPSDKKSIAILINKLLDGHAKQGTLYKAFSEASKKQGILGRNFSLDGFSLLQNFHFTVRTKPLTLPSENRTSHTTTTPSSPALDPVKTQQQETEERQQLLLEIKNELTNRPAHQKLVRLMRAAASLQAELDGTKLPAITPIITTQINLSSLTQLSLSQLHEQAKQLKEENISYLKQLEENTTHLPTTQDHKLAPHISAMLQIQFIVPYIKVLDDSIAVLKQPDSSIKNRLLSWLLPGQAKARQDKQNLTIGKLHELRQLITTLQSQGGNWQNVEKTGWAIQLLARNLKQATPGPWKFGPIEINSKRKWQTKLTEWGIPVNRAKLTEWDIPVYRG